MADRLPAHRTGDSRPGNAALAALRARLAALTEQVNQKLLVDERFECGSYPCGLAGMVRDMQDRFGLTLLGACEFDLSGRLAEELRALAGPIMYRGAGEDFPGAMLDAWLMALRTGLPENDQAELAAPVASLRRSLPGSWTAPTLPELPGPAAGFLALLLARRRREAAAWLLKEQPGQPESAFESLVVPALTRVGELWVLGRLSVAEEHAATEICRYALFRALDAVEPAPVRGRKALVACAPGEEHELGAEMVAGLLELSGWDVFFVGRGAPEAEILECAERFRPDVTLLGAALVASLPGLHSLAGRLRAERPDLKLVAGGRAAMLARERLAQSFDEVVKSAGEGRAAAERLAG